jgi:hypothetical protein
MKKTVILIFCLISFNLTLFVQTPSFYISQYLNKFSPLGEIIARNLGLEDKNGNGGTFAEKEKSIDCGFHANYVMYGTGNAKLEENEIVNYYYLTIRFKHAEETAIIDNEIKTYIYANGIPLVWLDDEQGTVMNTVTQILGEGWNEKEVTENEAVEMFFRVLQQIRIRGHTGELGKTEYYYTLPEFVTKRAEFCTEAAQFGFWFFSELRINSVSVWTMLTSSTLHKVLKLSSGRIVDYFGSINWYNIPNDR